jgi:hypothetical protein
MQIKEMTVVYIGIMNNNSKAKYGDAHLVCKHFEHGMTNVEHCQKSWTLQQET